MNISIVKQSFVILLFFWVSTSYAQDLCYGENLIDSLENLDDYPGYAKLDSILKDALPKVKAIDDRQSITSILLGLSYCHYYLENHIEWGEYLREALLYAQDTLNIPRTLYASALNNLAVYENSIGNHRKGNQLYLTAVEQEQQSNSDPYEIAVIYDNISTNYNLIGDHRNALIYSKKAFELKTQSNANHFINNPDSRYYQYSISLYNTGLAYQNLNQLVDADIYFKKSLENLKLFKPKKEDRKSKRQIKTLHKLAEINAAQRAPKQMIRNIKQAQHLQKKNNYREFKTYQLLGEYYALLNKYSDAEKQFTIALEKAKVQYSDNKEFPAPAKILKLLGDLYLDQEKLKDALNAYQKALQYVDKNVTDDLNSNPNINNIEASKMAIMLLSQKAKVSKELFENSQTSEHKSKFLNISYNTYSSLVQLASSMRNTFINDESKFHIAESAYPAINEGLDVIYNKFKSETNDSIRDEILFYLEFNKSSILFKTVRDKFINATLDVPKSIINKELEITTSLSYYQKTLATEENVLDKDQNKITSLKHKIFELNQQMASLQKEILENHPKYYKLKYSENNIFNLSNVQSSLAPQQLLIEFWLTEKSIYCLSVSHDNFRFDRLPIEHLEKDIIDFYNQISTHPKEQSNSESYKTQGYKIFNKLIDPTLSQFNNVNELIIIPDKILGKIPFECLSIKQGSTFTPLVQNYNISYLYSIQQINDFNSPYNFKNSILCMAPLFEENTATTRNCQSNQLTNLPYAQEELKYLKRHFEGIFLSGDKAKTQALSEYIGHHNIIHLATHGCLNVENPMLSEIFFADNSLTNYDIENYNVRPGLVVLSACNTGSGTIENTEGVISLSRGFFEAGVKSLQSSLWSIDDHSSAGIMKDMYAQLKQGQSKSQALKLAKISHLKNSDKLRQHPYFWAGMIHIGDPSPLFKSRNIPTLNKYITTLILLFGVFIIGRIIFKYSSK